MPTVFITYFELATLWCRHRDGLVVRLGDRENDVVPGHGVLDDVYGPLPAQRVREAVGAARAQQRLDVVAAARRGRRAATRQREVRRHSPADTNYALTYSGIHRDF